MIHIHKFFVTLIKIYYLLTKKENFKIVLNINRIQLHKIQFILMYATKINL